jgi:hypothetical protein
LDRHQREAVVTERTSFTPGSAKRIADVVRKVEQQRPEGVPLSFDRIDYVKKAKVFRVCTFTGSWSKNSTKTVTFKYQTSTPNTAAASNLFADIGTAASSRNCAIAREGTAWYLIAAEC